jgi:tol-pal system protein YbgF
MMVRLTALLAFFALTAPALAQSQAELAQLRIYVQQLEQQVRQLTGQNEQLTYQLKQLQAQTGPVAATGLPAQGNSALAQPGMAPQGTTADVGGQFEAEPTPEHPEPDFAADSIAADDPLIAPDGDTGASGAPVDLSALAGADPGGSGAAGAPAPGLDGQVATLPNASGPTALSGSSRDQYDLAYGYVLTGDYDLAEKSFQDWLAANPSDPQALDAQFWLGESHYQQKKYREAANSFLTVYKQGGQTSKAPDALLKLGMSLAALGEKPAACATLAEVEKRYPQAGATLLSRVEAEVGRAGC